MTNKTEVEEIEKLICVACGRAISNCMELPCGKREQIYLALNRIYKEKYEGMIPEENMPLPGSLQDKYGYLAGQRKGYNLAIIKIRARIKEE